MSRKTLMVDSDNFVYVDGVKVGKAVKGADGEACIQFFDKDNRRSAARGTDQVTVAVRDLVKVCQNGPQTYYDS